MTAPASGNVSEPGPNDAGPGFGLPTVGSGNPGPEVATAAAVLPVGMPVPVDPSGRERSPGQWLGRVIDPVPTTADDIAALVLAVPDVVRLHAGRFGEVATYLPGRRITGVKLGDDLIEVHVVVAGRVPVRDTAQLIHAAVATTVATPVHVYVEDIAAD